MTDSAPTPLASTDLSEDDRALLDLTARTDSYRNNPVPQELLDQLGPRIAEFATFPPQVRSNLFGIYPKGSDVEGMLQADWQAAWEKGALKLFDRNTVSFPLRMVGPNGQAVDASVSLSTRDDAPLPWYLKYVPAISNVRSSSQIMRTLEAKAAAAQAAGGRLEPGAAGPNAAAHAVHEGAPAVAESGAGTGAGAVFASTSAASTPAEEEAHLAGTRIPPLDEGAFAHIADLKKYAQFPPPQTVVHELSAMEHPFLSTIHIPKRWAEKLKELAGEDLDVRGMLDRDFAFCLAHDLLRSFKGKILFPASIMRSDGVTPVEVSIKRDQRSAAAVVKPWMLWGVDDYAYASREAPGRALEHWAYLGPWTTLLEQLADLALPESWNFEEEGPDAGRYVILRSYLNYTFFRLQTQGQVLEDEQAGFAAFNTGLVNKTYDALYACFVPNEGGPQRWRFDGFCKEGSRGLGKRLVSTFNPLPKRARYIESADDLLYDPERKLSLDTDHILLDNMDRLPVSFLEEELRGSSEAMEVLEDIKQAANHDELSVLYQEIRAIVEDDSRLERRLINRLNDAVDLAKKRVEWNFRTAVPAFFPTRNSMSPLLPLDLTEDNRPDIALVVQLTESGAYLGQTILTMRMAYNDARLVCRPDSDWLNTSVRLAVDPGEEWQ